MVPNLSFLKKKAKKAGSYALQQLQEEIKKDAEDKARANEPSQGAASAASAGQRAEEATSDEDDFLQKTGKTTADAPALEVPLPEKKRKKRLRISPDGEPIGKSIRFDENGEAIEDTRGVVELKDVEGEIGEEAEKERLKDVQMQLEENEEKDRMREKRRVKEKKMLLKQREKEMHKTEEAPVVLLGNDEEEEEEEEEDADDAQDSVNEEEEEESMEEEEEDDDNDDNDDDDDE